MIVMKFGGSSIGRAERILAVAEIVRERLDRSPVVVVSALGGVTDLLESAVEAAGRGRAPGTSESSPFSGTGSRAGRRAAAC